MVLSDYKRSSLRAFHLRSKLRRLVTSTEDTYLGSEVTPPLTPVEGDIPRKVWPEFHHINVANLTFNFIVRYGRMVRVVDDSMIRLRHSKVTT